MAEASVPEDPQPHPLAVRLHALALRALIPSLGRDYAAQASVTFGDLYRDARAAPWRSRLGLWGRELRAMIATAFAEHRESATAVVVTTGEGAAERDPGGAPPPRRKAPFLERLLDPLRSDLRYAARNLLRSPGFSLVAVAALSLGITAAIGVFSLVNALVLRPAPHVADPHELVRLFVYYGNWRSGSATYSEYLDLREQVEALEDVAAFDRKSFAVETGADSTRGIMGGRVSANYFDVLGIPMALGRGFTDEEEARGERIAVIGHRFWQRAYGGDSPLGEAIRIDGKLHTIVGVAPQGVLAPDLPVAVDVWVPAPPVWRERRSPSGVAMIGRLGEGVTLAQFQGRLGALAARLFETHPETWRGDDGGPRRIEVARAARALLSEEGVVRALGVVTAVVAVILLIGCSNAATLLLTRALRRRREIAVRLALGAGRTRLVRQLLTESVLLTIVATVLSLVLIHWLTRLLWLGRLPVPAAIDLMIDARVAVFSSLLALGTGIVFGLVPAFQASRPAVLPALKGMAEGRRLRWFGPRRLLVAVQVAGSLLMLTVAALLLRSIQRAADLDLGFDPQRVALVAVELLPGEYTAEASFQFHDDLTARLTALPGVESVALSQTVPFNSVGNCGVDEIEGVELAQTIRVPCSIVSPGYFELVRMSLLGGRGFTAGDRGDAPSVVVVNRTFASRFWPGESPLGKRVDGAEVIGVVADSRFQMFTDDLQPQYWYPYGQLHVTRMWVHVRTAGDPRPLLPVLRAEVLALDGDLLGVETDLMARQVAAFTRPQRVMSMGLGAAGLVALLMAMVGLYGIMASLVGQRTHEVGVRIALGARPETVIRMIVRQGVGLASSGLILGLLVVVGIGPLLRRLLVGLHPLDPVALAGGLVVLLLAASAASFIPARRAARVDPVEALRAE